MSGDVINHDGDRLGERVPLVYEFHGIVNDTTDPLLEIAECHWADPAPANDKLTMAARANIRKVLFDSVFPAWALLVEAIDLQGNKLNLLRHVGENTEAGSTEIAGGWGEGGRNG